MTRASVTIITNGFNRRLETRNIQVAIFAVVSNMPRRHGEKPDENEILYLVGLVSINNEIQLLHYIYKARSEEKERKI